MLSATQVEASYTQQGYHVERNEQFGFLVVSDRANTAVAAAASANSTSISGSPLSAGWLRNSRDSSSSSDSNSSSTDGVLAQSFAINGWRQTTNTTAAGSPLLRDLPSYGSSSYEASSAGNPPAAAAAAASSAAATAAARTAAMQQQLGALEGVERVELNVQWGLLHRTPGLKGFWQQRRMQQQQQRRSLRQTAAGPTCGDRISYNPDYQVGRTAEGTPYGVSMVSAQQQQQQQQQHGACICHNHGRKSLIVLGLSSSCSCMPFSACCCSGCTANRVTEHVQQCACPHILPSPVLLSP
jgi:hypothetical protein